MRTVCNIFLCCVILTAFANTAFAQTNNEAVTIGKTQELIADSLTIVPKATPSLYFIPYSYPYNPNYLPLRGNKLPMPNNPMLMRNNTESAMNSIYTTLEKDRERDKRLNTAGMIIQAAFIGGVAYQMIDSKNLTDRMKERREAQQRPPVRR